MSDGPNFCGHHADLARVALEDIGLGSLIADSEEEALRRTQASMFIGLSPDTFEPLSYCVGVIGHAVCTYYGQLPAEEFFGAKAVKADVTCLLCGAIRVHSRDCGGYECGPLSWIKVAAQMTLNMWHKVNA